MSNEEVNGTSDSNCPTEPDDENVLKILIATDIHLGYNEKHPIRGKVIF